MFKKNTFLQITHSTATQLTFFGGGAKNEIQQDSSTYQGAQPRAEFSEATTKRRTGGDTPTFQRVWEPENTGKYAVTPRKARLSCLYRLVKT